MGRAPWFQKMDPLLSMPWINKQQVCQLLNKQQDFMHVYEIHYGSLIKMNI